MKADKTLKDKKEKSLTKKKVAKKKSEVQKVSKIITSMTTRKVPLTEDEIMLFLSSVVAGEVKDFAGLDSGLDVRIKAAKELREILKSKQGDGDVKPQINVSIKFEDGTNKELKHLDDDLKDEV